MSASLSHEHQLTTSLSQVDIPLLYVPLTDQAVDDAYVFYRMWYEAPGAVKVS